MAVDWRTWVFEALTEDAGVIAVLGDRVFSEVEAEPEKPFAVVRMVQNTPEVHQVEGAISTTTTIWVHDEPGSYVRIDNLLSLIRTAIKAKSDLSGVGIFQAIWTGDGPDLADDYRKTILRTTSYRLVGRR